MAKQTASNLSPILVSARRFVTKANASLTTLVDTNNNKRTFNRVLVDEFRAAFPNVTTFKRESRAWMKEVRTVSNNGTAYAYARQIAKATYGGLVNANGQIANSSGSGKGMTLGRWQSAMKAKIDALTEYVDKAPSKDIEPDAMELVTAMLAAINQLAAVSVEFDAYVESEKLAADEAKAAA